MSEMCYQTSLVHSWPSKLLELCWPYIIYLCSSL